MYKFLSRSVTKSHSGTLNFTNICRKVSKTHNKSCSILKRSVSDSSIKSEIALDEKAEEITNSEQKTDELTDSRSPSVLTKKYHIFKKSLFAERPKDLIQIRKFRTSSATYFFSSGIYQSKKSPKSGFPNFRVADTYKKAMEQCLKIKNQKKRNDHPFTNDSLHPKPVKFEKLASEISKNTEKIESNAKIPKKRQAISTKQLLQEMTRYKKTINIDHPKQKEPFRIIYPTRKFREVNSLKSDNKVAKKRTSSEEKRITNRSYKIKQLYSKEKENYFANRISTPFKTHNEKYVVNDQNRSSQDITNAKPILSRYAVKYQVPVKDNNKLANILMSQHERAKIQKQDDAKNNNRKSVVKEKKDIQNHPILFPEESKINLDHTHQNNTKYADNFIDKQNNKYIVEDTCLRPEENNDYNQASTTKKLEEPTDGFEEQQITKNIEELLKRNKNRMSKSEDGATSDINNYIKELNAFKEKSAMDKSETEKPFEQVNEMIKDKSEETVKSPTKVYETVEKDSYEENKVNKDLFKEEPRSSATVSPNVSNKNNLLENFGKNDLIPAKTFNGNKEKLQKILLQYRCEEPEETFEVVYEKSEKCQSQRAKRAVESNVRKINSENKSKSLPALPVTPMSKYIRKIKEKNNKDKKAKKLLEESPISTTVLLERVKQGSKLKTTITTPEVKEKNTASTVSESDPAVVSQKVKKIVAPSLYEKVKLAEEIKIRASNFANKSKPKVAGTEFKNESTPCKEENIKTKVSEKIIACDLKENDEVIPLKMYLKESNPPDTTYTSQKLITDSRANSNKLLEGETKEDAVNEVKSGFEENSEKLDQVSPQEKMLEVSKVHTLAADPSKKMTPEVSAEEAKQKFPRVRGRVLPQARNKRYSQLNVKDLKRQLNDITTYTREQNGENSEGFEDKNSLEPKNNQFITKDEGKETFQQPRKEEANELRPRTYEDLHLKKETTRKNRFVFKDSKLILTQKRSAAQSDLQQKNKNKKRNPRLKNRREISEDKTNKVANENSEVKTKPEQKISIEENSDTNKQTLKPVVTTKTCSNVLDLNESNPTTTNDVCTSFKTFNDSYFLNFKHANRAEKQDVVDRFQSGENMTDPISHEDVNSMTGRIDIVDNFHLLKEVANKARERLKFYNKKSPVKDDKAVTSSTEGEKGTTSDVSVEQPFIRKEIPRPITKRDDKAKKDPPKPKTSIILPPPKNQEGTKLDDEIIKTKQPPEDKLIYKNTNDLRKLILMEGDEKYRENLKYIVALIEDIKIDYKDGSDPNLIKLAQEQDIENQKKSVPIINKIEEDPADSNINYCSFESPSVKNKAEDILKEPNESMKQETVSQKSTVRRQPLPTHIVRKLMKIKLQRDRRRQYDRTAEYEKFFNVVTNPQEAIIQKPVLKLNHSDSSLMKMYLMEDDSKAESFMFKNQNRPTTFNRNPERAPVKPSGDIKIEVEEVFKEKEPDNAVTEQVLRSLKRTEKFIKDINDAAVKNKLTKEKHVTDRDEKFIVDVSDIKNKKSVLLIFNPDVEQKPDSKLEPTNFLSKATLNTSESSEKEKNDTPIKKSPDPLNKVNFKKICEDSMKNKKPNFNISKKIENASPNQAETGKKRVVFVLTKSSPTIKSMSKKFQSNKYDSDKNPLTNKSKSVPIIEDGKKDSKTKALIEEFEKKSSHGSNDSVGKHKNKILKLEECFNRIVTNLKKLDERGQLVKSVVSSVNGMVYKCTNKFLEEIYEKKAVGKQKQSKTELKKPETDTKTVKINKSHILPKQPPVQINTVDKKEASQVLGDPQFKRDSVHLQTKEVQQKTKRIIQLQDLKTDKDVKGNVGLDNDVMTVIRKSLFADNLLKKPDQKDINNVYTSKLQSLYASDEKVIKDLVKVVVEAEAVSNQSSDKSRTDKVKSDKLDDTNENLNLYNFKDLSDNRKILEGKEITRIVAVNDEKTTNVLGSIGDKNNKESEDKHATMKHIEITNFDLKKNRVKTITVENSSGEIKNLKSSSRLDKHKNCNTILKDNNIVKIIVQTQTANIVITSNKSFDPKLTQSNESPTLKVAIEKLGNVGKSLVEKKSLESQFEKTNTMKKLVRKVSETINIIEDKNISNKMYNYEKQNENKNKDSEPLYKNVFNNLDALKMPHIFDRIKASDQLFKTSASKISTKSLEQLNKEDCTRYCFAEYDYSYAKRKAKKQLDKKLCKLDCEDGICFKAYFSSVEKRMNKAQDRSPSIKFHKRKEIKRKLGNKTDFNCKRSYSTMLEMNVSGINIFKDQESVTRCYKQKCESTAMLGNEERLLTILSNKDGDKPDKPSDKKMPKEDEKNKKSDKSPKKTIFKIIRAPNIYRAGRRYKKSVKLKSKNDKKHKTETPKKSTKPTYHGRRNVILYLLQNQFNNKINKTNLKSERKLSPKEEVEKAVDKFKVDVTHDNETDFHTVSLTDTELYKEKRLKNNGYKNKVPGVLNSKTKTSVNEYNKKSTNIKINPDENVNKSNDTIIKQSASKYLLENQALLYKKYSADLKGKETILKKQSVLKSTVLQKSTSKNQFNKTKFSKDVKSENKSKDEGDGKNKSEDKKPPKASLNDEPTKPETFQEILNKELSNIFENGPLDYQKYVAKVEEIVDNKDSKLHKFNKNLNNFTKNKSTSSNNLKISEITIEKDVGNILNIPPQVTRETFATNSKKDCEIVRIPTKSLFQTIYSLPNENDTTLTKRNTEKIMSVRKSGFRRYPGLKITYVAANKGDTDISQGHFSPKKLKTNLLKEAEADTQSIISARYELLKKLQNEFNKLHSIGTNLELNQAKPDLNESKNQSQDCKDAASHSADDTCLEKGSNQSLIDDEIVSDFSSNSDCKPKAKNNLETILRTWINKLSSVYENDKKDPNK